METQQQQIQFVNDFVTTGYSVQRMIDTDDNNTDHDDSTFAMTESNSMDDEEYRVEDVSLRDDEETAVAKADAGKSAVAAEALRVSFSHEGDVISKNDADKVTSAPSSLRSIVDDVLDALKPINKRQSNRDHEGSDGHIDNCSIQTLGDRYPRRGAFTQSDLFRSAVLAQSYDSSQSTLEDDVKELRNHVRSARNQRARQSPDVDDSQHDPDLALRIKDFHHARHLRSGTRRTCPYGIFGLFANLADIRLDLAWAEDAAWRREQGLPFFSWVDYEYLRSKKYHRCPFTNFIMIVSAITLVVSIGMNGWRFAPFKVNPAVGPDPSILIDLGALLTRKIVEDNEWYRLVAPIVLHAGIIHYVINMIGMLLLGTAVERVHGTMETAAVFMLSGVGGNFASAIFMPNTVSVGASGGLFGLLGFCMADVLTNWDLLTIADSRRRKRFPYGRAIFWLSVDLVLSLGFGLTPYVDNFAHLGGFLFGICFGLSLLWRSGSSDFFGQMTLARHYLHYAVAVIGTVVATSVFAAMLVLILESDGHTTVCPRCRYLSCAPFPFWTSDPWWHCDECEQSLVSIVRFKKTSGLDLTCPNGDIVTIALMDPDPDRDEIRNQIIGYCRQWC